ncbi:hypothetical protein [Pedobacter agri]|uniref:hypothetical protein n=1 Tax=Pedobacter agri TaxID=454586 RepID=UPI002930A43C|nr:hypothetical protein [Pedobacter agri]
MKKSILIALLIFLSWGCSDSSKSNQEEQSVTESASSNYEIITEVQSETPGKAQLLEYAVYTDTLYSEVALKTAVMDIYDRCKNKDVFENHEAATVIAVYLYTSKGAIKDKSDWIAMLMKSPNSAEPYISFNQFKISALSKLQDKFKSKDEIELDKIKKHLKGKGIDLCDLSDEIKKTELDNIHRADAKYPDYGEKHMAMIDQLDEQFYNGLKRRYNLDDAMLSRISVFAMSYCK